MTLKDQVWQTLKTVPYPGYNRDIVSFGLVKRVAAGEGRVSITLEIGHLLPEKREAITAAVHQALLDLPAVKKLRLDVEDAAEAQPKSAAPRPAGIRRVLAVGSGKGGVGKSTVAVNLAVALARQGLRAGLMDTDVYGPNVPRMLGIDHLPRPQNGQITPAEAHGVRLVSMGFLTDPDAPLIWRGPITDKLIRQFLTDVAWGELDVLVVDLPPGTGDVAISVAQHTRPDGAVVVVTPQEVALDDARKAVRMFEQFGVPVLGLVENMSYFECGNCHTRHAIFGHGGGRRTAENLGLPFLGELPLEPAVRSGGDQGQPAVVQPGSQVGGALQAIAAELAAQLRLVEDAPEAQQPGPQNGREKKPETVLDVRQVPPPQRHPLIFETFAGLQPGESFILANDHDPKPLYYQFQAERAGQFTWEYLEQGPQAWRVRIGRPAGQTLEVR